MQTVQWNKFIDGQGHKPIDYSSAPLVLTAELLNGRWEHDVFESEDATEVYKALFQGRQMPIRFFWAFSVYQNNYDLREKEVVIETWAEGTMKFSETIAIGTETGNEGSVFGPSLEYTFFNEDKTHLISITKYQNLPGVSIRERLLLNPDTLIQYFGFRYKDGRNVISRKVFNRVDPSKPTPAIVIPYPLPPEFTLDSAPSTPSTPPADLPSSDNTAEDSSKENDSSNENSDEKSEEKIANNLDIIRKNEMLEREIQKSPRKTSSSSVAFGDPTSFLANRSPSFSLYFLDHSEMTTPIELQQDSSNSLTLSPISPRNINSPTRKKSIEKRIKGGESSGFLRNCYTTVSKKPVGTTFSTPNVSSGYSPSSSSSSSPFLSLSTKSVPNIGYSGSSSLTPPSPARVDNINNNNINNNSNLYSQAGNNYNQTSIHNYNQSQASNYSQSNSTTTLYSATSNENNNNNQTQSINYSQTAGNNYNQTEINNYNQTAGNNYNQTPLNNYKQVESGYSQTQSINNEDNQISNSSIDNQDNNTEKGINPISSSFSAPSSLLYNQIEQSPTNNNEDNNNKSDNNNNLLSSSLAVSNYSQTNNLGNENQLTIDKNENGMGNGYSQAGNSYHQTDINNYNQTGGNNYNQTSFSGYSQQSNNNYNQISNSNQIDDNNKENVVNNNNINDNNEKINENNDNKNNLPGLSFIQLIKAEEERKKAAGKFISNPYSESPTNMYNESNNNNNNDNNNNYNQTTFQTSATASTFAIQNNSDNYSQGLNQNSSSSGWNNPYNQSANPYTQSSNSSSNSSSAAASWGTPSYDQSSNPYSQSTPAPSSNSSGWGTPSYDQSTKNPFKNYYQQQTGEINDKVAQKINNLYNQMAAVNQPITFISLTTKGNNININNNPNQIHSYVSNTKNDIQKKKSQSPRSISALYHQVDGVSSLPFAKSDLSSSSSSNLTSKANLIQKIYQLSDKEIKNLFSEILNRRIQFNNFTELLNNLTPLKSVKKKFSLSGLINLNIQSDRDWNEEYQILLENMKNTISDPELHLSYQIKLQQLSSDFAYTSTLYGNLIINEISIPDSNKTVLPMINSNGTKYLLNGILFSLFNDKPIDKEGKIYMYGNRNKRDDLAMKAASQEMISQCCLISSNLDKISFPLMCVIDFKGLRMMCTSLLPIDRSTLIYGFDQSDEFGGVKEERRNNAKFLFNDELHRQLQIVADYWNLAEHQSEIGKKRIFGPTDLKGHLGKDKRNYFTELKRVMPPEAPSDNRSSKYHTRSVFYQFLRPELVVRHPQPLSSDVFTGFSRSDPDRVKLEEEVKICTNHLFSSIIPQFAADLDYQIEQYLLTVDLKNLKLNNFLESIDLVNKLHFLGINLRHLGKIRALVKNAVSKEILLAHCIARVIKNRLKFDMRNFITNMSSPSDYPFKQLIITHLNLSLCKSLEEYEFPPFSNKEAQIWDAECYWDILIDIMDEQYPDCISAEERNANGVLELRNKLNTRAALYYLLKFEIFSLRSFAIKNFNQQNENFLFVIADVRSLEPKIKEPFKISYSS